MRCRRIIKVIFSEWEINKLWPSKLIAFIVMLLLLWGTAYTIFEDHVTPYSDTFILSVLFILAYIGGQIVLLVRLPPLFGMILVGFAMVNLNFINISRTSKNALAVVRSMGLVVILLKAGLGLDALIMKRLYDMILRLGTVPVLVETMVVMCMTRIIFGLPWVWGLLLGFLMSAIAPAVVVPSLQKMQKLGYGENKSVATILVAASTIDCIISIVGFGIFIGITFSEGTLLLKILHGPIEIVMGLAFGILWGFLTIYIPHDDVAWVIPARSYLLGCGGLFAVFGSIMIGYSGAGPLSTVVTAVTARTGWRKRGWRKYNDVLHFYSVLWKVFEPAIFAGIGTKMRISLLSVNTVAECIAVLFIGLIVRLLTTFVIFFGTNLNLRERLFITGAWIPKATVQAALGPEAQDMVQDRGIGEPIKDYAQILLEASILAIMIAAPLGAIFINASGTRLLERGVTESDSKIEQEVVETEEAETKE